MFNYRALLYINGVLLTVLGGLMVIPLIIDFLSEDFPHYNFAISCFITFFLGISLMITCKSSNLKEVSICETFLLTTILWFSLAFFAALPFYFSPDSMNFTDSFFEAMSGLTTTGATIISDLESKPPGILTWRALLEWFGGIGVIVLAINILPVLRIGGMQLFQSESSDQSEKVLPRMQQISAAIGMIYLFFTIACATSLYLCGMGAFDAILHSLTTVSSGGFSPYNKSIGHFDEICIERVIIIFMICSAIPFPIYIAMLKGNFKNFIKDQQIQAFFSLVIITITIFTIYLIFHLNIDFSHAFRIASFNITSILTTTGYASADYSLWGPFAVSVIFLLSVVGGCTGSTTGGIKIFRFQILYHTAKFQLNRLIQPHLISQEKYNHKAIAESTSIAVMSFFILFAFCFSLVAVVLATNGLDFLSAMSGAAAIMSNLGPGLGEILGPHGNYSSLTESSKWVLTIAMLIGRLEIFTVFVIFTRSFWKN